MKKIKMLLLCMCLGALTSVFAQQQDSIRFSLLTCAPGDEIYALFGHTALRYQNFSKHTDIVFNYGMFHFEGSGFIYRFVKGETDYQLGLLPYKYFEAEYAMRGSSVYQQVLNLTQEEKIKLLSLLEDNYLPENRTYRYNYFYDNCTTRARDRIEESINGEVVYPEGKEGLSFRRIIHEFTSSSPWDKFGIDLCLGAEADAPIDGRKQMFAPFYMRSFAKEAYILDREGRRRPLVLQEEKVVDVSREENEAGFPLSPMMCASLFLVLNVWIAWLQWRRKCVYWGWNIVLYGAQGLAGCIIAFLFFVSIHPTVGSNWMLILFNPFPLFYLPFMVYRVIKRKRDWYHTVNVVYLTLFIAIIPFSPQEFNLTVLPLAIGLLVNATSHVLVLNRQ